MPKRHSSVHGRAATGVALLALSAPAWSTLKVETVQGRGTSPAAVVAAQAFVSAHKRLEAGARQSKRFKGTFFFPQRVELYASGQLLPFKAQSARSGDLTLSFASSGSTAFDSTYKAFLQSVYASAKPTMDAVFGQAAVAGTVKVVNDDATISDRRAVVGGYYVPNASGGPEIRLPVNADLTTAAINFIHATLLAYQGPTPYPFDAYNEGLVRAATIAVARTPGSIPGNPSTDQVEAVLNNLYQADDRYDWLNQTALSAQPFIAPNLLNAALPAGGSTGGIYLLRHQMAGSAWEKVLVEYPGFAAEFNRRYYASPATFQTEASLWTLAQTALDTVSGHANTTVEGRLFADWSLRQAILFPVSSAGPKLLLEPLALTPLNSSDFGVFDFATHAFKTDAAGNETLVGGTCFPVYFRPDFSRFFITAQDDVIGISAGYGSVAPNFPADTFASAPYKVVVDTPFDTRTARVNVPAGGMFAPSGLRYEISGTVSGFGNDSTLSSVRVDWTGGTSGPISIQNGAFAGVVAQTTFDKAQPVTITLFRGTGTVLTRRVNKGKGPLVVDLKAPATNANFSLSLPARLGFVGVPLEPFRPYVPLVTSLDPAASLVARYNSTLGRYIFFPDEGDIHHGLGYFARAFAATSSSVKGTGPGADPVVVSLRAGWNMVTNPTSTSVAVTALKASTTSQPIVDWATASGNLVGSTVFALTPDSAHPDGGTLVATNTIAPGQGVYVRCLASEGAVLVFGGLSTTKFAAVNPTLAPGEWQATLTASGDMFQSSNVVLGQRSVGTTAPNLRWDTSLPPSAGGFQAAIDSGAAYYQRVLPMGALPPMRVVLSGLTPGRWVTLSASTLGKSGVSVKLPNGITANLTAGTKARFKATNVSAVIEVKPL